MFQEDSRGSTNSSFAGAGSGTGAGAGASPSGTAQISDINQPGL